MDALWNDLRCRCLVLRGLQRHLVVVEPCVGLGGLDELGRAANFKTQSIKFDTDPDLIPYYNARGMKVNTGVSGDILKCPRPRGVEGGLGGPPCQHPGQSGNRLGTRDERSAIFEQFTDWLIQLGWDGTLIWFGIENSANIMKIPGATPGRSYGQEFIDKMEVALPFFWLDGIIRCASPTMPFNRTRWWMRGLRDCNLIIA